MTLKKRRLGKTGLQVTEMGFGGIPIQRVSEEEAIRVVKRCYELGKAIRTAVRSANSGERVGILASGGLSHFTVDEDLDRAVLDACKRNDGDALSRIPVGKLNSGSSEIRNWIAAAGAAAHLKNEWQEYVPCYRSAAGTGCGMGFAVWQ